VSLKALGCVSEQVIVHGDGVELDELLLEEVELAIDLVESSGVACAGIMRSVTNFL